MVAVAAARWIAFAIIVLSPLILAFVAYRLAQAAHFLGTLAVAVAAVAALSWLLAWTHMRVQILAKLVTGAAVCEFAVWIAAGGVAAWPDFGSSEPGNVKAGYAIGSVLLHLVAICAAILVLVWFSTETILDEGLRTWAMWAAYLTTAIGGACSWPAVALCGGVVAVATTVFIMVTASPFVAL